jgi:hypothetical protein
MRLVIEILAVYFVYVFGTSLLIWRYGTKDRGPSALVAAVLPFIVVVSFFQFLFMALFRHAPLVTPCPDGLAEAELIVENHRQRMFGGRPVEPHFASDWANLYAMTVEQESVRVQKFARKVLDAAYT